MEIIERINQLKKQKKAFILAHNYQLPEVQDVADFVGDSLEMSIVAKNTQADVLVCCGVKFMAETAKILSPKKTVLLPRNNAGCPMADMITAKDVKALKLKHPQAKVLAYVNTSAEVKAESDLCCTSANSVKMVEKVLKDAKEIIFVPDKNLGRYTQEVTGRKMIIWPGYCPIHENILEQDVMILKNKYPLAELLVHPECSEKVVNLADQVLSTGGMLRYVKESKSQEFIIGTEKEIIYRLTKENPGKKFYPITEQTICKDMKYIKLNDVGKI